MYACPNWAKNRPRIAIAILVVCACNVVSKQECCGLACSESQILHSAGAEVHVPAQGSRTTVRHVDLRSLQGKWTKRPACSTSTLTGLVLAV